MPKFKGTPKQVYNDVMTYLDKQAEEQEIVVLISKKETKEMLLHTQRKMFRWLFREISKHLWEDPEQVKQNFLKWCFGVKEVKTWLLSFENAIKPTTSELTKKDAVFFIETIIKFIEKYWVPCKYTSADFNSLCESYN